MDLGSARSSDCSLKYWVVPSGRCSLQRRYNLTGLVCSEFWARQSLLTVEWSVCLTGRY